MAESSGPAPDQARRIDSAITASSWRTCPKVKARKKMPSVDGAMTRNGSTRPVAPARRRSAWSMWLAPARIAVPREHLAPRTRAADATTQVHHGVHQRLEAEANHQGCRHDQPRIATSDGSSKVTPIRSIPRDLHSPKVPPLVLGNCDVEHRNSSSAGGTFRGCAAYVSLTSSVDRG